MTTISIIMPCYNAEPFISDSIGSIIRQTYKNWELIVVDDCSTDKSYEIIDKYSQNDSRIKVFRSETNQGVAFSRNKGIASCTGEILAFLDSDDLWENTKLEVQKKKMDDLNCPITFTAYSRINGDGKRLNDAVNIPEKVSYSDLLKCNYIGLSTSMIDLRKTGKHYFKKTGHEDYLYWLELLKKVPFAYGINMDLVKYRVHNSSLSNNKFKAARFTWNIYSKELNLSLFDRIYYFVHYALNAVSRRLL